MKKFIKKVKALNEQATRLKAAVAVAPAKAAELREIVSATTGQLRQLGADIQSGSSAFQATTEQRLVEMLQEIDASAAIFREAGYALSGAEMELGIPQRLVVHLIHVEEAHGTLVRALITANESRKTTHAILSALSRADELAGRVALSHLTFHKLTVYVGPVPCVRLCWEVDGDEAGESVVAAAVDAPSSARPSPGVTSSVFGADSFFEPRAPIAPAVTSHTVDPVEITPEAEDPATSQTSVAPEATREDPLARFKKMPDLSKYRR